jgi:NitT/TauT family transport system substrate-binding protein
VREPEPGDIVFPTAVLKYIGITPGEDAELVTVPPGHLTFGNPFADGRRGPGPTATPRLDALFTWPTESLSMRDTGAGHSILNSMTDEPWSQQYCCVLASTKEFVEKNPIATKRALRGLLRGIDHSAESPEQTALTMYENGWAAIPDYALETAGMIEYGAWRTHDPEDSLRFYALRLQEAGLIKSTPEEIIERGTDWSFLEELKKEMAFQPQFRRGPLALNCDISAPRIQRATLSAEAPRRTAGL